MNRTACRTVISLLLAGSVAFAQTPPAPDAASPVPSDPLSKRLDEMNAKLDALSQQILKIEQHLANQRPGVMIGEKEAPPPPASMPAPAVPSPVQPAPGSANAHTVARGETLTAIAKQYKVTVEELQKFNHIEDGRKLQAGQTVQIPPSATPAPSATPQP